jgi:biotin transporter BioY
MVVLNLQNTTPGRHGLPYKSCMLCVSLVVGTTAIAFIYLLFSAGYISIDAAIWTAIGVFIAAAIYESVLLSLIVKHMLNRVRENVNGTSSQRRVSS